MLTHWDLRFLREAQAKAEWSKDPSTKVGAVIADRAHNLLSVGYNGFPAGLRDDPVLYENRDEKISRIIHAEMNALLHLRQPMTADMTLYTWPLPPCDRCMVHLIQAGLRRVVTVQPTPERHRRWNDALRRAHQYLIEAGGTILYVRENAENADSILFSRSLQAVQPDVVG